MVVAMVLKHRLEKAMSWIIGGCVLLVILAAISPPVRRTLKAAFRVGGSQVDALGNIIGNVDPLQQYKTEIANAAEGAKNAQSVVDNSAVQLVSLQSQIETDLKEKTRLENRLQAVVSNGDPNKSADRLALELERIERNLDENTKQLESAQANYDKNLALVSKYEVKISDLRKDAQNLGLQLEQSEAEKKLAVASSSLKSKLDLSNLSETRNKVLAQINANRGVTKANNDMAGAVSADEADDDLERKERAKAILARFQLPGQSPVTPAAN